MILFIKQRPHLLTVPLTVSDSHSTIKIKGELPFGTELPGTIRFFEDNQVHDEREFDTPVRVGCTAATDVLNPTLRLGLNMYCKDLPSAASSSMTSLSAQAKSGTLSQAAALKAFSTADKSGEGLTFCLKLCDIAFEGTSLLRNLLFKVHKLHQLP